MGIECVFIDARRKYFDQFSTNILHFARETQCSAAVYYTKKMIFCVAVRVLNATI